MHLFAIIFFNSSFLQFFKLNMTRKRSLTPEEQLLWEQFTRDAKPLTGTAAAKKEIVPEIISTTNTKTVSRNPAPTQIAKKNAGKAIRKGEMPIDAVLDLHGMTQEKAYSALLAFIEQGVKEKNRCLLVITGKGAGILRSSLPKWVESPKLSKHVWALELALAKHGGDGAYYVYLKRKRS